MSLEDNMSLGKQAKTLSNSQQKAVLNYVDTTRSPERNKVIFLLSVKAGFRAKEIAKLKWSMVSESDGEIADCISLTNEASKGNGGGVIWMNKELKAARKISAVGGSIKDVQMLARHSSLIMTQRYIEADVEAMKKVVELV